MTESYTSISAALRQELARTRKENVELRREKGKQKETMAALAAENEELRKERDSYKEQLHEAKEQHATELREVTEEMAAAARLSDSEWREHCDRLDSEVSRLQAACTRLQRAVDACLPASLEMLPGAEAAARQKNWEDECAGRKGCAVSVYRAVVSAASAAEASTSAEVIKTRTDAQLRWLCRAVDCTRAELRDSFLGRDRAEGSDDWYDTRAAAHGLWTLFLALCDVGFLTDTAMKSLLEREDIDRLYFNAIGHDPDYGEFNYAIPPTANAYDFFHRLLRHLPALRQLCFSHLPPLSSPGALRALLGAARRLKELILYHTDYTVADLFALHEHCLGLGILGVSTSHCTDWGEYAAIDDMEERKRRVGEACGWIIAWNNE